jgi:hypothetical protein
MAEFFSVSNDDHEVEDKTLVLLESVWGIVSSVVSIKDNNDEEEDDDGTFDSVWKEVQN